MRDWALMEGLMEKKYTMSRYLSMEDLLRDQVKDLRAENERLRDALEEIASYDAGATAGLAYTAKEALK